MRRSTSGTTRDTCLRSRASTQASSSNSGISPAMCTGKARRIEPGDAFDARFTRENGAAKGFFADAIRADNAHSSDHYPRNHNFVVSPDPPMTIRRSRLRRLFNAVHVTQSGIIVQNAAGPLYIGPVLPDKVQLLQLRLGCLFPCRFQRYVERVCFGHRPCCRDCRTDGRTFRKRRGLNLPRRRHSHRYSILAHLERLFVTISQNFEVKRGAEITVECAPGTANRRG